MKYKNYNKQNIVIIILSIVSIISFSGWYSVWKNAYHMSSKKTVSSQKSQKMTNLPITGTISGKEIIVDVKERDEEVGTMTVMAGWIPLFGTNEGTQLSGALPDKRLAITDGETNKEEYVIVIHSRWVPPSLCGGTNGDRKALMASDYIYFKDQQGNEYFRQRTPNKLFSNKLEICSKDSHSTDDLFYSGIAVFGAIEYEVPNEPSIFMLNEMDNIVASFK